METKKSIVRQAIYQKSYTGKYGEGHIFEITLDNGDKGQYFGKTKEQSIFQTGKEIEYTIEQKTNGQYTNTVIKPAQQNGFVPGKGNPAYEHKRVALKCAVDLCAGGIISKEKIVEYAGSFMKFLND